jgi:hypothetical protein
VYADAEAVVEQVRYQRITQDIHLAREVWNIERDQAAWLVESSEIWHKSLDEFEAFWRGHEVWGMFADGTLSAIVYLEAVSSKQVNIHVSVVDKVDDEYMLIAFFRFLRELKAGQGYTIQTGWLLKQNRPMLRVAEAAGFSPTGLKMDHGQLRGRVSRWIQVRGR